MGEFRVLNQYALIGLTPNLISLGRFASMTPKLISTRQRAYFNPIASKIQFADDLQPQDIADFIGCSFEDVELIGLAGAPEGSIVTVSTKGPTQDDPGYDDPPDKIEQVPEGLLLTVKNQDYISKKNEVVIYRSSEDSLALYIKLVDFNKNFGFSGVGALMVRSMLETIDKMAPGPTFDRLRLMAAGGRSWGDRERTADGAAQDRWIGYNVWPKMGFDMDLHEKTHSMLPYFEKYPKKLKDCKTVQDVLALPDGGRDFWLTVGDGWYMEFGLARPEPKERLNKYLAEV